MSATSSGSDKRDDGSPPGALGSSTKETGEGTEGNVCNACENQAHATTHCTQCKTNPNLTGESDMSTSAQSQSKGEINISDGKLADDNEKGEKNKITPREQDKVVNNAMQRAQNNNPSSNNVQDENVCAEKGRGLIVATVADQLGQYNSSRNAQEDKDTLENFEKNEKHMVAEAAADADHKTETGEHTSYENNKQMYQEDKKRSASPKQTLEQRNDTPSKSESVNLNQGNEKQTTPPTAKGLQSAPQTENPNQGNGMPSTLQTENSHQGNGTPSKLQAKNPDQVNGTQSTPQTENSDPGDGTPSTPQMEIQNQGNGTPSALQAKNPDQGNGTPSTPQTEILNQENGKPSTSQTEILNQENGKPSTSQTEIQNQGNGTPSTLQANNPTQVDSTPSILQTENSNQGDSTPSALQAKNPDQGNGTPSTPQTEILNQGNSIPSTSQTENPNQRDGRPPTWHTEIQNQGNGTPSALQAKNPDQGNGTPSTPQTEILNQENCKPSTSQTEILNQRDDTPPPRHTEIQNQGNGTPSTLQANNPTQGGGTPSILQTENSHQGNGTPSALRAKNPDQGNGTLSTPQIEIQNQGNGTPSMLHTTMSNQGNGIPLAPQTENLIQGNGTPSTPQTEIQNQGNGTPSIIQGNNLTQEDNAPSSSQAENSHQGDSTPSALQAKNPDQGNGIPLTLQTEILNQGNSIPLILQTENPNQVDSTPSAENLKQRDSFPSVIGDRVQVNTDKGNADIKVKNDRTSELDAGNLHESDEDYRTTEKERQYAITKTQLSLLGTQVTDYANRQIEEGATYSEHSHIPFSFSQSQADFTVIEYQLDQVIDKILNDSTLHENKEEWKKNAKKELMVFLLGIVKDETLSHRTFHPCVTHSMPIQIFDSDIHVAGTSRKGAEKANTGERLSISAHTRRLDSSNYTSEPNGNEKCQQVPSGQTASDSPGKVYSKSLCGTSRKDAEGTRAASAHTRPHGPEFLHIQMNEEQETAGSQNEEELKDVKKSITSKNLVPEGQIPELTKTWSNSKDALNAENVVTSQPEPIKSFTDTTLPNTKDKEKMCKHNIYFVLDPGRKLTDEEWGLKIECASPEFYKLLFSFSNENITSFAKKELQNFKVSLSQSYSHYRGKTCSCIKLRDQRKLDRFIIGAVVSVCYELLKFVHLTKVTIHPDFSFEQLKTCFFRHDAFKNSTVQFFYNEKKSDEVWIAVESDFQELSFAVLRNLLNEKKLTMITQKWENYDLSGYFLQCAALNEMDAKFLNLMREKYQDVDVSSDEKWAVFVGQTEIYEDLLGKMKEEISALRKVKSSCGMPPSLRILFTFQEVLDFVDQTVNAKHSEPIFWKVKNQPGKNNLLEVYALHNGSAKKALQIILKCFREREFDDAELQKEAFELPVLQGDKFRGKIVCIAGMKNKTVKIAGTEDVFEEYIDLLIKESNRLKKPVCKTVQVKSTHILRFCETHHRDIFTKWSEYVKIEYTVGANGTCGYIIKGLPQYLGKMEEIANELKIITSDVREIQFEEEEKDIKDMSENAEFRKQRCEIEKEWSVDTFVEGVQGQDWSVENGFEWRFSSGPSFTLLILKSALPVQTDVVLQPIRKDNVSGKRQKNIQKQFHRDWPKIEFEAEYNGSGKAKESLRKSLKSTLLLDVKRENFQTLVFPVEKKIMEGIGWSITHYLKQILVVLDEDFSSEPWSLYFVCGNEDELKTCTEILEKKFERIKMEARIKSFPIQENVKPAITIEVRQGSLVETKADVIVNTTHKDLKSLMHGYVSKSILDAAGIELSRECRKKYPQGIEYCEVAVTSSFELKECEKIYHGGIPYFKESLEPLKKFVWNCLFQATEDNMQTIAFPAIGTGNLNYPKEAVAETMINTVLEFSDKCPTTLQSVFFVIFDNESLQEFKKRSSAKQTNAASNTQTPSVSRKVKITVVGIPDKAEAASNCLHDFIENFKKKKEDGKTRKQDEAIQSSKSAENKGIEKSITDKEASSSSKLGNERENVSVHGESLRLILVKTASESDPNLTMSECRKHLNGIQYKKIICPFENTYSALVKFERQKDVDQVLSNKKHANYAFENLPKQVVHNVKAKLSKEMIHFLKTKDVSEEDIENASGASLNKIEWLLTGHLLEIKQAARFLKQVMSRDSEPRTLLAPTSLPNKLPDAQTTDMYGKRKMYCSISDWEAIRYFYQDVASKLYYKPDLDGVGYWLSGKPEAIDEFSHALDSIFKVRLNNVSRIMFDEIDAKNKGVYCYFVEEQRALEIFAKSQEKLDLIEENLSNFNKRGSESANTFDKKQLEYQTDNSITTGDDKNVENEMQLEISADDFDTVCHFYKEFSAKFKRSDKQDHIIVTGPKHLVKQFKIAQKDIKDNFFGEIIVLDGRGISRVQDVFASMTETDIHVRTGKSGSNNIIMLTGKNKHEVCKMKSWFEDELEKKKQKSRNQFEVKKRHSSLAQNNCLVFQEGKFKVYALKEDILQVNADALVCPTSLHVGYYIQKNAGINDFIVVKAFDVTQITDAPKLDTCTMLIHTKVPRWSDYGKNKNPCEDCIEDISSIVQQCLSAGSISSTIAFPEFVSDENCKLPALICCMGFARGVNRYIKDDPKSDLNIYYVVNNPFTTSLLKRCFRKDVNWEYKAGDDHSIFLFCCKFQVHVKKADVFKSTANAIAASQDPDMKNERFIAHNLYQMNDNTYQSELKGRKLSRYPIITNAPRQCGYEKVIHFVSPNWRNMKNKRDEHLKKHSESIQTLLNEAKWKCSSVVIPLSGGHFTDWETRKEIAKSTAIAVAEWCKENAKKAQKLETIFFLHDDSSYIKELIECCRQHPCLKDQPVVVPPTPAYSTPV